MKKNVTLSGKLNWAHRLFTPESYEDGPPFYSVQLVLDDTSRALWDEIRKTFKLRNTLRDTDEGKAVTLRRGHDPKEFKGKVIYKGGSPVVVDKNGADWDSSVGIGNGSTGNIELEVYSTSRAGGSRIKKVTILDHVIFETEEVSEVEKAKEPVPF